ncbi:MAG: hypothetical protein ACFB03_08590 [Paracoccaceae bacterium]
MTVTDWQSILIEELEAEETLCDCCGQTTTSLQGDLLVEDGWIGFYFVNFTRAHLEHSPNFRVGLGNWSEEADTRDRWIFSADYHPNLNAFTILDHLGETTTVDAVHLSREDIVGQPFSHEAFALLDAIYLKESRLEFLRS